MRYEIMLSSGDNAFTEAKSFHEAMCQAIDIARESTEYVHVIELKEANTKQVVITSKMMQDVVSRALTREVHELINVVSNCDPEEFIQYQAKCMAEDQLEAINFVRRQLK